jgi:eukaryotic-like serine/threonine-protein kinase
MGHFLSRTIVSFAERLPNPSALIPKGLSRRSMRLDHRVRVQLGSFELNLETGQLCPLDPESESKRVFLPEKPFRLLSMLVELEGELASRDEIKSRLWPNDTIVDFEHSINVAIAALRRAFGDSATEPKYIETVPRRGYRLVVSPQWAAAALDREKEGSAGDYVPVNDASANGISAGPIGRKVSHFRVIEVIGGGGMGMVYRAEDLKLGRQVALKFLPEELAADPASLKRFEREAQTASALNHPNICTIFEIEDYDGQPIIVMELLDGKTLRDRLAEPHGAKIPLDELLRIALGICDGLQAAHAKGIIHRDIKPANIFLTGEGSAKILDFGLAKLVESEEAGGREQPDSVRSTNPLIRFKAPIGHDTGLSRTGLAMGTTSYMSPEQVRREKLDARTDLFSFGLVLFEMATGERAFPGNSAAEVHQGLLHEKTTRIRELNPAIPPMLQAVIEKALEKEPGNRYGSAAEMRAALELVPSPQTLRLRRIRNWVAATVLILLAATATVVAWRYLHRFQLAAGDTIVIADITNRTSDPVLDDALNFALPVELSQTPFLQVLAQDKVRETMAQLHHPQDGKVTPEIAREVCLKTNSKAVITSSIVDAGNQYWITLTGVNCQSGKTFARSEQEIKLRDGIVHTLGVAGEQLRSKMGEPSASLNDFKKPLEMATSSSPEALQSLSKGFQHQGSSAFAGTASFYERAIDIDPSFALAYASVGISYLVMGQIPKAVAAETKAYELRDRLTGQLRFLAETLYYNIGSQDLESSYPIFQEWIRTFPLDGVAHNNFANCLFYLGQYDRAATEAREAVRLMPLLSATSYYVLMQSTTAAGRLEEAKLIFDEARAHGVDNYAMRSNRHLIAFLQNDQAGMKEQLEWLTSHKEPILAAFLDALTHSYRGRFVEGQKLAEKIKMDRLPDDSESNVRSFALQEAEVGDASAGKRILTFTDKKSSSLFAQIYTALFQARIGNIEEAEKLSRQINEEAPRDTLGQHYALPSIRAAIKLSEHDPEGAIEILRPAEKYELSETYTFNCIYPAYLRGLAFLQIGDGRRAASEFQKLIDHRAIVGRDALGALAHLQMGRAQAMAGDRLGARKSYQDFLTIWKDADANLPALIQARAEYAALR